MVQTKDFQLEITDRITVDSVPDPVLQPAETDECQVNAAIGPLTPPHLL
jgi:hypothetical protein